MNAPTDDRGVHTHDFRETGRCICGVDQDVLDGPGMLGTRQEMVADLDRQIREAKAAAWAEGLKVGWEATSDRVHYNMPTGYRDVPRHLKRRNPYGVKP